MVFKQFKPTHLAPQGFTAQTNLDKMKDFIIKFCNSDTVKKEVGEVTNFLAWIADFKLD